VIEGIVILWCVVFCAYYRIGALDKRIESLESKVARLEEALTYDNWPRQ
jgi:hypothetical protein